MKKEKIKFKINDFILSKNGDSVFITTNNPIIAKETQDLSFVETKNYIFYIENSNSIIDYSGCDLYICLLSDNEKKFLKGKLKNIEKHE